MHGKYSAATKIYENFRYPYTMLKDCTFKNWKNYNLNGLFDEYSEYTTILGNRKKVRVVSALGCETFDD